ncbi:cell division protein ZapA [Treponema sp. HNW]|uniref:cell division protein ZapA n=1 Tax=Treponema sp. HNW TaxID=3116654 RepID=UPI003D1087C3
MGTLNINILGTSFSIQAKEDDTYLKELLLHYKKIISSIESSTNLKDNLKIAIMAGLSLCDELKQSEQNRSLSVNKQRHTSSELFEAERITLKLIENIDKAMR